MKIAVYWCPLVAALGNGSQRAALPHQGSWVEISFWAGLLQSRQAGEERRRGQVSQQRPLTLSKVQSRSVFKEKKNWELLRLSDC